MNNKITKFDCLILQSMKKTFVFLLLSFCLFSCNNDASQDASEQVQSTSNVFEEEVADGIFDDSWKETFSAELRFLVNEKINIPTNQCDCDSTRLSILNKWQEDKNHAFKNKIFYIFSKICDYLPDTENCEFSKKLRRKRKELTTFRGK